MKTNDCWFKVTENKMVVCFRVQAALNCRYDGNVFLLASLIYKLKILFCIVDNGFFVRVITGFCQMIRRDFGSRYINWLQYANAHMMR